MQSNEVVTNYNFQNYGDLINGTSYNGNQPSTSTSTDNDNDIFDKFVIYYSLSVGMCGAVGHVLSLIILFRPPLNEMPHSLVCGYLSMVDLAGMLFQISLASVHIASGREMILINSFLCRLAFNLSALWAHLDAWTLALLSAERSIAVFWPLRARMIITKSRMKIFLAIVFVFFILFDGENSVRYGLVKIKKGESFVYSCQPVYFYGLPREFFMMKHLVAAALMVTIPLIIITTCNVAILIKLALRRRNQAQLGVHRNESSDNRTNGMLIAVMLAFVLCNSPIQIYIITMVVRGEDVKTSIVSKIAFLLMTTAMALNFYLYCVTSSLFRDAVKNLFQCKSNEAGQAAHRTGVPIPRGRDGVSNLRARLADQQPAGSKEGQIPLKRMRY